MGTNGMKQEEASARSSSSVDRLTKDLALASETLTDDEARYLVDQYYAMQDNRKRSDNQVRALGDNQEPHGVLVWLATQSSTLEDQIKRALDRYTDAHPVGYWMKSVHGIGPVIAAGFLAHIDISRAPTVGHIWSFAGLNPKQKWNKGEKRPWNARLKVLAWKAGQSFMKFSNAEECFYGHVYRERKDYEIARNESGANAAEAKASIERVGKGTEAYKAYSVGRLPPGRIDARARRYAVKLFLAHLHEVWRKAEGFDVPLPYPIGIGGHAHKIEPPEAKPKKKPERKKKK